ncbi:unnamed protein product [Ceutorhynchus assimilis]|uniref:Translation elongation factor EFTu/EF1A C-terminal domain-containing protein n=1 Tax=Ceutorhynchus assimilis TaxID=467358 RepID=A0A9P0DVQ5_9CUCU|nr:unnamed protein product [Ceutorhynchus assimilis]
MIQGGETFVEVLQSHQSSQLVTKEREDQSAPAALEISDNSNCSITVYVYKLVLKMMRPMVLEQGQRFTLRDGSMTLGTGVVTKVLPLMKEEERLSLTEGKKAREKKSAKQ